MVLSGVFGVMCVVALLWLVMCVSVDNIFGLLCVLHEMISCV